MPVPIGGAEARATACAVASSSSVRRRTSCEPPAASIAACSATALSQAACPCRSIIAAWHCGGTAVRSDACAPASE